MRGTHYYVSCCEIKSDGIVHICCRMGQNTEMDFQRYGVSNHRIVTDTFGILVTLNTFFSADIAITLMQY